MNGPGSRRRGHVGNAGVGVVSMRGVTIASLTFATGQFKRFFECDRDIWCVQVNAFGNAVWLPGCRF